MLRTRVASRAFPVAALGVALSAVVVSAGACRAPAGPAGSGPTATTATGPLVLPGSPEIDARGRLAPVLGAAVTADGRSLEVYAQPVEGGPTAAGSLSARAEVRGDAIDVVVERGGDVAPGAAAGPSVLCRLERGLHVLRVPLTAELGARPVRDVATGVSLDPVPLTEILRPSGVPSGWRLLDERPLREGERQTGWIQRFGPDPDGPGVTVVQRRAALGPSERFAAGRVDRAELPLRSTTAQWSRQADGGSTALVWIEAGWETSVSSSAAAGAGPLERDALTTFAASLRPAGP